MITQEQRAERTKYIGSSDAAAVLGLSRWSTPLEVWALKTGQIQPKEKESLAIELGNELEDVVARLFTKKTGKKVQRVKETIYHPEYPFIAANLDRRIVGEDALLEIKTAGAWAAKSWEGEEIPQEVIIQVLHQLAVTGKQKGYACCLIGGNMDFHIKTVFRDEEAIKNMIDKEVYFWKNFVETNTMPMMITKNDGDVLGELFPMSPDEEPVRLDSKADEMLDLLESYDKDLKALTSEIDKVKNEVKAMLKNSGTGFTDNWKVTWRDTITKRVDLDRIKAECPEMLNGWFKESKSRVFRSSRMVKK